MIRPVAAGDREAVISLWQEVFPEYADPGARQRDPQDSFDRKLRHGDDLFWLDERDDVVVGTVMAGDDGHRGWVYSLGVHPSVRRRGIAAALVRHAEDALAALGCPKVNLQVRSANAAGLEFWRSIGYRRDEVESYGRRLDDG